MGVIGEHQFAEICASVVAEREQIWEASDRGKSDALWYALFLRLRDHVGVIPAPALKPVTGDEKIIDLCRDGIAKLMREHMEGWFDFRRLARECVEDALNKAETT